MSISNDIRKLLDIQDNNITFTVDCVKETRLKGKNSKIIEGTLTYIPKECKKCGIKNEHFMVYKNGSQTSRITLPMSGIRPTYLVLKKQRFMCKSCSATFTAQTPLVQSDCFISNTVKAAILSKSSTDRSVKDLAVELSVSQATVQRVIDQEAKGYLPYYHWLPSHLSFDEFKYARGQMAFEYIDVKDGKIIDLLPSRESYTVKNHFLTRYSLQARKSVKTITVDMNAGYIGWIPIIFPNAKIIIDRFHIIQLINRAMNRTRVMIMNRLRTSNSEDMKKYRRLKHYWRKLLKHASRLSYSTYTYYKMFGLRSEGAIVEELLSYDPILRNTYDLYQNLLSTIENNDYVQLLQILGSKHSDISSYMKTSLKTLKKHQHHIQNTFIYKNYTNGKIEGMNNKIKVLNKVAYGYRNFINYRNRIILHFNLKPKKERSMTV